MAYANTPATTSAEKKLKFSVAIRSDGIKNLINNTLGDPNRALQFVADISSVVAQNKDLQECEPNTIITSGLQAASLKLPLSPTLGFAYVLPYNNNKTGVKEAQFQIGYKGLIQLGQRSGQFERLGVRPVHEGEIVGMDEFGDDIFKFSHEFDNNKVVGYYAYFKLTNGFKKGLYWTCEQCEKHGTRYSSSHRGSNRGGKFDRWDSDFDSMASKTVLKLLLNRYAPMSVDSELGKAIMADQAVIRNDGTFSYVDNDEPVEEKKTNVSNTIPDVDDNGVVKEN